ncbi:hypothetical protein [Alteribacillus iranensis]|nr:hypothetical protein [Alteribacillus iranensis]
MTSIDSLLHVSGKHIVLLREGLNTWTKRIDITPFYVPPVAVKKTS